MEINNDKFVVVNGAFGSWYPKGQERMVNSLRQFGYNGDILTFCDEDINEFFNKEYPYTIKTACIQEAISKGFTKILWVDCSCYAIKPIEWFYETIKNDGCFFSRSGFTLAQTSTDSDLMWANVTRDEAENLREIWSCVFGFDLETEKGHLFWELIKDGTMAGVCNTSRFHSNQSQDKRFLFGRQDQTLISHCLHKVGYEIKYNSGEYIAYANADFCKPTEKTILLIAGM